jgi:hypothetical protein
VVALEIPTRSFLLWRFTSRIRMLSFSMTERSGSPPTRQMDAEPLFGHRMAIFQTSQVTALRATQAHRPAGQPPGGILAGFAYPDEDVFPLTARCKPDLH